ncbi:MAG: hypothetical protein IH978_01985, partial [Nitrospinae bacterium]|nr:hypothetical protein [Nitrospinota bacterium]
MGEGGVEPLEESRATHPYPVIPAKAGIQAPLRHPRDPLFRHPRENGDPDAVSNTLDSRLHHAGMTEDQVQPSVLRMSFTGANKTPTVTGSDKLPGIVNYFIGNDPQKWHTKIPTYKKVHYENLYEGIDLAYYGHQGQLEYDLIVAPGADPNQIQLAFQGTERLSVNEEGDLVLSVNGGDLRLLKPHVYQLVDGEKIEVVAH